MIGKRAKILAQAQVEDLLFFAQHTRHPIRNQVIVLLSLKAGLRAAEIANLAWDMVVDPTGEIATTLELRDRPRMAKSRIAEGSASAPILQKMQKSRPRLIQVAEWPSRAHRGEFYIVPTFLSGPPRQWQAVREEKTNAPPLPS